MLTSNRLRIDLGDGSCAVDYKIDYGRVESRILESAEKGSVIEKPWHLLTAKELTSHVMADTVVAHWLRHRMGIHRLIRACDQDTGRNSTVETGRLHSEPASGSDECNEDVTRATGEDRDGASEPR